MNCQAAFNTPAILLRRIDYGDDDLIVTVITPRRGKLSMIAKAAKRSRRRFGGVLDLFNLLTLSCKNGQGGRMPLLSEASLCEPFSAIRAEVAKAAYASYWAELVDFWGDPGQPQPDIYELLRYALTALDRDRLPVRALSLLFQLRFMHLAGLGPHLSACIDCQRSIEAVNDTWLGFDPARGSVVCGHCGAGQRLRVTLGTIKQLQWIAGGEIARAERIRFSTEALREGENLMEAFVPFHLGREPRSLKFLRHLRDVEARR